MDEQKKAAFRQGNIVVLLLAVLTIAEFAIAIVNGSTVFLFIIALIKAAVIVQVFMHVSRLWREESH
ncbi:MAG: cytochrome C oxidase subunit IV family protein [Chloroflexi bacterium]|nr:cytochrome C oxidase subunit IV family protein [Chloroflexota bacterium]MBK6711278.1 cytochrome C oxidase subunit IV family protein [Chloroflexota bacterium]MBK7176280.1 cytochrome C oxidase subunit IV family protein [Chloroflexota bacterium]MBK7915841.1 cytochrome C oxidase subunit IV family protein [Chloroflexota bacterium]MBK8931178.1 cytochrome C oxidase subunit IV family protein [Chloroflexota bacterium]